ncbi:hypothetical protein I3760_08G113600, partial [Carya illinoinensis]
MILLSWNSRGLGNQRGVQAPSDLVREEGPKVLFLQETRLQDKEMEKIKYKLGYDNCLAVNSEGRSGGLALLWKNDVNLDIRHYSMSHIHASIQDSSTDYAPWYFTGVYGQPEASRRHETSSLRTDRQIQEFRELLDDCGLLDLGYIGNPFTW